MIECFPLGRLVVTPGALEVIEALDEFPYLRRHAEGDWGDLCADDKQVNEDALRCGTRILSHYATPEGRIYIITEADRSSTCILRPEEY